MFLAGLDPLILLCSWNSVLPEDGPWMHVSVVPASPWSSVQRLAEEETSLQNWRYQQLVFQARDVRNKVRAGCEGELTLLQGRTDWGAVWRDREVCGRGIEQSRTKAEMIDIKRPRDCHCMDRVIF